MAAHDFEVVERGGASVRTFLVEDRDTSGATATLKVGEPVKLGGTGNNFALLLADGDPEIGTDRFIGIVTKESTETAAATGEVEVLIPVPGKTILRAAATTAANVDTQAELDGIKGDAIALDLAAGVFTLDENEGSDPNVHGFVVIDGDIAAGTLDVMVQEAVTLTGGSV